MASERGPVEHVPEHREQRDHQQRPDRQPRAEEVERRAGQLQEPGRRGDVLGPDGLARRIPEIQREEDAPGAERHDERRQREIRHQGAIDGAAKGADPQAQEEGYGHRHAHLHRELTHYHRRQDHDCANRQINAGGQHDQGLREADDADDGHLLEDQRQVEGGQETAADQEAEEHDSDQQHDSGDRRRIDVQEVLQPPERCAMLFLERRLARVAGFQHPLEFLTAARGARPGGISRHRQIIPAGAKAARRKVRSLRYCAGSQDQRPAADQPQHCLRPSSDVFDGKPSTGLSVISSTPVL